MDDEVKIFFKKSLETLEDSRIALENERYNMSVNRSYYACFYAAKSLLLKKGQIQKTHSGTIQQFGLEYVVNNDFDGEIAKIFSFLEDYRENTDYDAYFNATKEKASENLKNAEIFIGECERFL